VITAAAVAAQEATFARAFAARDLEIARPLYASDVVYLSPTVRLFGWPARIEGVDRALAFIAETVARCESIAYRAVESAVVPGGAAAFVRIHFDWTAAGRRLRSSYVVIYRYAAGARIARQELYYDPSAAPEVLKDVTLRA
jgi:ketosteroid isomerase-like protein